MYLGYKIDKKSTHAGCILWGNRMVVPEKGRNYVLQELHGGISNENFV